MENIEFDSEGEELFYHYLNELKENDVVLNFSYHPETYELSESIRYEWKEIKKCKEKTKETTLLQGHVYTPDYYVEWNPKFKNKIYGVIGDLVSLNGFNFIANRKGSVDFSIIEIKPPFDRQNMTRLFTINQKWVMSKYKIYVQKITPLGKPPCLFSKTFVPKIALLTKVKKQPKKFKFEVNSIERYLNEQK